MTAGKPSALALLPTALLFGLGVGNLWGVAGLFTRLGNPEWIWVFPIVCLAVLVICLCGVARVWWSRGALVPLLSIVATSWLFSAPWAALNGKFTVDAWGIWLLVLLGCGAVAFLAAWILERKSRSSTAEE